MSHFNICSALKLTTLRAFVTLMIQLKIQSRRFDLGDSSSGIRNRVSEPGHVN